MVSKHLHRVLIAEAARCPQLCGGICGDACKIRATLAHLGQEAHYLRIAQRYEKLLSFSQPFSA